MLVLGLSPGGAYARNGKVWTLQDELTALSAEVLAHLWSDELPDQIISHPDRPKPPDTRQRTSDPAQIVKFLSGR